MVVLLVLRCVWLCYSHCCVYGCATRTALCLLGCAVTVRASGRILMEAKETAVRQLDHERQRTAEGKQAYDQLMSTHRDVESKLSNQVRTSS